jgi:hypothetical protein
MQRTAAQSGWGFRKAWPRLLAVGFAGVLGITLGTGNGDLPWAQEPSTGQETERGASAQQNPDGSATRETEPDGGPEPKGPPKEPRLLPPRLRPRVLTAEEHEEAERLKKLGAKYGTDPTAIVGRVQVTGQYSDLAQGAHSTDAVFRVDLPFRRNWLLRVDTPFLKWVDPNRPGATSAQGMSDLLAVAGWRAYNTPEYAFFIGALTTFPTAAENTLGLGKYTVGPFIATARFLPRWESFLFGVFQHQVSVGGDPARADVSFTRAIAQINTIWAERWWTTVQGQWQIDWERSAKSSMTLEFELGRSVVGRWGVFGRPGVGIWGRDLLGAFDWNIEVGIRYIFPSFLAQTAR